MPPQRKCRSPFEAYPHKHAGVQDTRAYTHKRTPIHTRTEKAGATITGDRSKQDLRYTLKPIYLPVFTDKIWSCLLWSPVIFLFTIHGSQALQVRSTPFAAARASRSRAPGGWHWCTAKREQGAKRGQIRVGSEQKGRPIKAEVCVVYRASRPPPLRR